MKDLKDRTALVTGSTSGIGRATDLALAARGARVLVTGRNKQRAAEVVVEIERGGDTAAYRLTALDSAAAARDLAAWAAEAGDGHVDILVNNVGVAPAGPTESATEAEFDQAFTINVKVPFFLVASLAPAMAARGQGAIVSTSTSSVIPLVTFPGAIVPAGFLSPIRPSVCAPPAAKLSALLSRLPEWLNVVARQKLAESPAQRHARLSRPATRSACSPPDHGPVAIN
jgi:NAD(P)-dependent dehydrogenase (short-subunit alcohol dehydrogenase family)